MISQEVSAIAEHYRVEEQMASKPEMCVLANLEDEDDEDEEEQRIVTQSLHASPLHGVHGPSQIDHAEPEQKTETAQPLQM
jgi:hypothetical protein